MQLMEYSNIPPKERKKLKQQVCTKADFAKETPQQQDLVSQILPILLLLLCKCLQFGSNCCLEYPFNQEPSVVEVLCHTVRKLNCRAAKDICFNAKEIAGFLQMSADQVLKSKAPAQD